MGATANRTSIKLVPESTWGTTPTSPAFVEFRNTGEGLSDSITTDTSKELRSDRMVSELAIMDSSPSGTVNVEFSAQSYDTLLEAVLMGTFSTPLNIASVAADLVLDTTTPHLSTATAGKFNAIAVGQWIKLTGFGAGSGFYRVKTRTGVAIDFDVAPTVANTPAGTTGSITGKYVRNGVTERSFTIVKTFEDADVETFHVFQGQRVKALSLAMKTGSFLTGVFNFVGRQAYLSETEFSGATLTAAPTTEVLNCVSNLFDLYQNGVYFGSQNSLMSMDFNLDNQHREQKALGLLGNAGVVASQLMMKINASQYFEDKTQADLFKASTAFSLSFRMSDTAGNHYIFTLPRCKYTSYTANATGLDTDVMAETEITSIRDPLTSCMVQIDVFPAA